jgi:drug/metabolite transporter (DMT)-like permease
VIGAGVAAAVAAALMNAYGVVLQAAEAHESSESRAMRGSLLLRLARRPRWLAGTGLMLLAGGCQLTALAFAPISVVQPMLATSQLALLAIARLKLRERVGPSEFLGVLAILAGVIVIVIVAPGHTARRVSAGALAPPLAVVGALALAAYGAGRWHPRGRGLIVVGAGLAYSWADFGNKLLSDAMASREWLAIALWGALVLCLGAIAFLEEQTALQRRPAVTVAPVIGGLKVPIPVLMALWAGLQQLHGGAERIAPLLIGLALTALGAFSLGRSDAVARVSGRHGIGLTR